MEYVNNIKTLMLERGITQTELARRLGVTSASVSCMLQKTDIRISSLEKIAYVLEVPVADLLAPTREKKEADENKAREEYRRTHVHGYLRIGERIVEVTCMQELRNAVLACEMNYLK